MARPASSATDRDGGPPRRAALPILDEETWRRFHALAALEGVKPAALVWRLVCAKVNSEWTERGPGDRAA